MRIIFSAPNWIISGVNALNLSLMRGFRDAGHDVELVIVQQEATSEATLPLPDDITLTNLSFDIASGFWRARWDALIGHLNGAAPCVYVPGYDFDNSGVVPCLSDDVLVLGVVHSDDPDHYEHLLRLGRFWNVGIAVSRFLETRCLQLAPEIALRLRQITNGVPHPPQLPPRERPDDALAIVYCGRLNQEQKRVLELAPIAAALAERGVPARWTIIGDGPEAAALTEAFAAAGLLDLVEFTGALPHEEVLARYPGQDCFVLASAYEGLPIALLEAMAHGVIPVASDIPSGLPEIVRPGENGYLVPLGETAAFADRLALMWHDAALRSRLRQAAFDTVVDGPHAIGRVVAHYLEAIEWAAAERQRLGGYRRPPALRPGSWTGDIIPPPRLQVSSDALMAAENALAFKEGERQGLADTILVLEEIKQQQAAEARTEIERLEHELEELKMAGLMGQLRRVMRKLRGQIPAG